MHAGRWSRPAIVFISIAVVHAWALAQRIAVITSPSAAPVSRVQVARIYMGRSFERRPLDLPEGAVRASFYKAATASEPAQVRAAWARIMFTGRGEPPRELPSAAAVKKAVIADDNAIGYIDAEALDASVRAVLFLP